MDEIYNARKIDDHLTTSGQPTEEQLRALADAGFDTVINLAPHDGRSALPDEPGFAQALGMTYHYLPVVWESPRGRLRLFRAAHARAAGGRSNAGALRGQLPCLRLLRPVRAEAPRLVRRAGELIPRLDLGGKRLSGLGCVHLKLEAASRAQTDRCSTTRTHSSPNSSLSQSSGRAHPPPFAAVSSVILRPTCDRLVADLPAAQCLRGSVHPDRSVGRPHVTVCSSAPPIVRGWGTRPHVPRLGTLSRIDLVAWCAS